MWLRKLLISMCYFVFFSALRWCFGLHGSTLAVEETQRHQSCFLTDQTLWERNANLCCDNADLLFRSRGIGPAGGEKRREGGGELRMMGKGKKIALVKRRGEERRLNICYWAGREKGVSVCNMKSWEAGDGESGGGGGWGSELMWGGKVSGTGWRARLVEVCD